MSSPSDSQESFSRLGRDVISSSESQPIRVDVDSPGTSARSGPLDAGIDAALPPTGTLGVASDGYVFDIFPLMTKARNKAVRVELSKSNLLFYGL